VITLNTLPNCIKEQGIAFGYHLMYPAPGIIEAVYKDWDWLWIDGQHGQHTEASLLECTRTATALGLPAIIRVAGHSPEVIGKALDTGACGIMVPFVESAEEAQAIVRAAQFPPLGRRSFGGRRAIDIFGRNTEDIRPLVIVQIETKEGVENAEAIAAVPGVGGLFFGGDDMRLSLGLPLDTPLSHPILTEMVHRISGAAQAHSKLAGAVAPNAICLEQLLLAGYTLIAAASDVRSIKLGSTATAKDYRRYYSQYQEKTAVKKQMQHHKEGITVC